MRPLPDQFAPYAWALSTAEIAGRAGLEPAQVLRFDGNTEPDPPPAARPEALADALARIQSYRHGGFPELVAAIARYTGVEPENVVLGAGADDLLMLLARSYAGPGDRIAVAYEPSYPLYRVAAWVAGAEVSEDRPAGDGDPAIRALGQALVELPAARPLAVDEAYIEYGGDTAVPLLGDGVVVVRTFSKTWSMAAARLGYCVAPPEVVDALDKVVLPYHLDAFKQAVGEVALDFEAEMKARVAALVEERGRLVAAMGDLAVDVFPSGANFVLFRPRSGDGRGVWQGLLDRSVLVRDCSSWPRLDGCLRVTIGTPAEDDRFLTALAEVLA